MAEARVVGGLGTGIATDARREPLLLRALRVSPVLDRVAVRRRGDPRVVVFLDAVAVAISLLLGAALLDLGIFSGIDAAAERIAWRGMLFIPLYLIVFCWYGLYERDRRRLFASSFPDLGHLGHALVVAGAGTMAASHLLHDSIHTVPRLGLTAASVLTLPCLVTIPATRVVGRAFLNVRGVVRTRVLILGSGVVAAKVASRLAVFDDIELVGLVDGQRSEDGEPTVAPQSPDLPRLGGVADLGDVCTTLGVDRVVVAFSPSSTSELTGALRQLPPSVQVSIVPRLFDLLTWRSHVEEFHGLPLVDVAPPVLKASHRMLKRALDLVVAAVVVVVGFPLWCGIAIAIKVTSPGPIWFKQRRTGRGLAPFEMYKFRTMRVGADAEKEVLRHANDVDGPLFKMRVDPRVTRIGRFLRATSLDELPQVLNVIKGEMSLVGPRPFVVPEADLIDGWASRRFDVRPGMTGLWQVSGRNDLPFEELRRLDYAYVASWSLWWDLKIIWQTPGSVLRGRGAY